MVGIDVINDIFSLNDDLDPIFKIFLFDQMTDELPGRVDRGRMTGHFKHGQIAIDIPIAVTF